MNLANCELIPSVIYNDKDPLKLGRVKCVVPGFIDNATMSLENMPWIRPFHMYRHQSFSKAVKGFKVWVIVNKSNYNEYWYIPLFEYNDISKEYLQDVYDDEQPEIFMSHNLGGNHAMSTYDEKNGFSDRIGQHHIELHPDGHIQCLGGEHEVDIDGMVKVGQKGGDYQQAVKGKNLHTILSNLNLAFGTLEAASGNPYTSCLTAGFTQAKEALGDLSSILADNVKVN